MNPSSYHATQESHFQPDWQGIKAIIDGRDTRESDESSSDVDASMEDVRTISLLKIRGSEALRSLENRQPTLKPKTSTSNTKRQSRQAEASTSTAEPGPGPSKKRARKAADTSTTLSVSAADITSTSTTLDTSKRGKRPKLVKAPSSFKDKDFVKRWPSVASYAAYLSGPAEELHPLNYHKDAPLAGVRAVFVTSEKSLTKALAINIDNLTRLGGTLHEGFVPLSTPSASEPPSHTTHVIVCSEVLRFKDVLKKLGLSKDADLVGSEVADGTTALGKHRQVWVIRLSWLQECCTIANKSDNGARKISEIMYLVECVGDKKQRKDRLIRKSTAPEVSVDPALEPFHMPEESQISTSERKKQEEREASPDSLLLSAHFPNFANESPLSFEDMALEIDMARQDFDQFIDDDEDDTKSQYEGASTIADRSLSFALPSIRPDPGDSDECPSDQEEAYKAAKEKEKWDITKEARSRKFAAGEKYRCDAANVSGAGKEGPNEAIASIFDQLAIYYERSKLPNAWWRVKGYRTAAGALRNVGRKIDTYEDAIKLHGIGDKTARKLLEIVQTGRSTQLENKTAMDKVQDVFTKIYGVGPTKASEWYHAGMRTLDDVINHEKFGITLTDGQRLGLQYFADLNERMPRAEVTQHFKIIKDAAFHLDQYLIVDCMGSYRRGQPDCGDIDIIVTRDTNDGKDHSGMVQRLVENLFAQGLIRHTLSNPDDWQSLDAKWMGLLCGSNGKMRRIDVLGVPFDELGAALIYFTGNDIFNRSLRLKARHLGYSLNQRGLFKDVFRDKKTGEKKTAGVRIASRTEQEIFDVLGTKWRPPTERLP